MEVLSKTPAMDTRVKLSVISPLGGRETGAANGKDDGEMGGGNDDEETCAVIDPLSQQILQRTSTAPSQPKLRLQSTDSTLLVSEAHTSKKLGDETFREVGGPSKGDKKKVPFLSRFMGANKKKISLDATSDSVSEADGPRIEGTDAQPYVDNFSFSPKIPQRPAYIKVRAKFKKEKQFNRLFLAQELLSTPGKNSPPAVASNTSSPSESAATHNSIWVTEFSKDGRYLAAGGQDKVVRIWAVIASPHERHSYEKDEHELRHSEGEENRLSAPVFQQKTFREYRGHTSTILDLSWSKNNFLLSSSMDKTVRLWHISRDETLCAFKHTDFVPSVEFHPTDDRFFLAGSLDAKLRLWSIPDKSVAYSTVANDMITAICFSPDGKTCIAGTLGGLCLFYDTEGLKWQGQLHVKSTRGQNAKGSKITSIRTLRWPSDKAKEAVKVLVSSNDSRLRIYNLKDRTLEMKFMGHENNCSQIRASFAETSGHIICGSEDRKTYIWSTSGPEGEKRTQMPVEMFEAHNSITTCAIMAPTPTKQLLGASEDPIYDLCNPPPVTLMSRAESVMSSPTLAEARSAAANLTTRDCENPAYTTRSAHHGGNIIVTADHTGALKVFRQDCAFAKRARMHEKWESSSLRRAGSKIKRTSSILSRGSRSRGDSTSTQPPHDRIMTWRRDVSHGSFDSTSSFRNSSPRKSMASFSPNANRNSYASTIASTANSKTLETQKLAASRDRSHSSLYDSQSASLAPPSSKPSNHLDSKMEKLFIRRPSASNSLAVYNSQSWLSWRNKGIPSLANPELA